MLLRTAETKLPDKTPSASTSQSMSGRSHYLYIDNLRTSLITAVILLHLSIIYGVQGDWYYQETGESSDLVFAIVMFVAALGSAFVLGLFFLLAGYFTPRSYDRKGSWPFLLDRFKRLMLPLAFYEIVLLPLILYIIKVHNGYQGSLWTHLGGHFREVGTFADGPVWFLLTLMIFSFAYAILRVIPWLVPATVSREPDPGLIPGTWTILGFSALIGITTFLVRLWAPVGEFYEPVHQEFAHYPQYIATFTLGILAYRRHWLETFDESRIRVWRLIAVVCILLLPVIVIAAGALSGSLDERGAGGWNWLSFSYSMWEGFTCIALLIVTLAWFRKRFNHQGRLARRMSEAAFTAFVIHPAVITPLAILLSGIHMNLNLKFLLVAPLGVVLTYVVSYFLSKLPVIESHPALPKSEIES